LLGMLPWTLLLPGLVRHLGRRAVVADAPAAASPAAGAPRKAAPVPQGSGAVGFFLLAALWSLVFFSASGCKRSSYILPVMPPLALALGCYIAVACAAGRIRLAHWGIAAATCFLLLFGAAEWLLPAYARKHSLREQVLPHVDGAGTAGVMCYPHGWDGVSFYLQRGDVRVFRSSQLEDMILALEQQRETLVVVKADDSLTQFLTALPESLEFLPCSRERTVTVGWVRPRSSQANGR
jgi:hypothetical protein